MQNSILKKVVYRFARPTSLDGVENRDIRS